MATAFRQALPLGPANGILEFQSCFPIPRCCLGGPPSLLAFFSKVRVYRRDRPLGCLRLSLCRHGGFPGLSFFAGVAFDFVGLAFVHWLDGTARHSARSCRLQELLTRNADGERNHVCGLNCHDCTAFPTLAVAAAI